MSSPLPTYMTAAEAAEVLRVKPWEVSRLCKAGVIKARKPGLKWLIEPAALKAYIDRSVDEDAA